MEIDLKVNGVPVQWDVRANETLLDALRNHALRGTKRVCESGECGACAVIMDGRAVDSCILLAVQAGNTDLVTVEGLADADILNPVQDAFAGNGAIQCGFCIPGMVVTATNFLQENPHPTEDDVRHVFVGNLCRCTGYKKPIEAVLQAAERLEAGR